jgi:hypothetical protein
MSDTLFILAVVAGSSLLMLALGHRLGMNRRRLSRAALRGVRWVGACLVFWTLNVALGAGAALLARSLHLGFVSLYISTDVTLLALSSLQAFVFESWREMGSGPK